MALVLMQRKRRREPPRADDSGLRKKAPAQPRRDAEKKPPAKRWRWFVNGAQPQPVPSYTGPVEDAEPGKVGICCSGGGIRSAAFSLGALQALQERGELQRAAYLAAVSGGSYIAVAISTVAKTGHRDSDAELLRRRGAFAPNSPEEQYLRNRSSYLAPTAADKLYLAWRVVLGLLLNLLFISTPLIGLTLILTGLFYAPLLPHLAEQCGEDCTASVPIWFPWAPLGVLVASALFGCATLVFKLRRDGLERFFAVWATRLLVFAGALGVVMVGLPYLVEWLDTAANLGGSAQSSVWETISALGTGFAALLVGIAAQLTHMLKSKDGSATAGWVRKTVGKLGAGVRLAIAYAAGALIGPLLLLAVVTATLAVALARAPNDGSIDFRLIAIGTAVLLGFAAIYPWTDLTTWSLHPFYRRRLSSAFSLKRVRADSLDEKERKRVEALVGSAAGSERGVAVERDYDKLVSLSRTALSETRERKWPTLLVCAAANVSDPGATPPGRQVTSFTFSSQTVGGPLVGAVRTWELESAFESVEEAFPEDDPSKAGATVHGARKRRRRDLTLPAAVAMSGAAISPSMGKMTRRPLTFLMTLANIRLGVWVPNPRWVGELEQSKWRRRYFARPRPWYLLCELLGRNRIGAKYLYVTDGGHYENLGLVELLRRGCTEVYCFDASGVGQGRAEFEALGEAIALARSELGVEIEFGKTDPTDLAPDDKTHMAKSDVVEGTISYPNGQMGRLLYVRNTMTTEAPWDAQAHQRADPRFPHNSTVDQLYTDQKFEAYRVLGARAGARAADLMLRSACPPPIARMFRP